MFRKVIFYLEEDLDLAEGAGAVVRALVRGVVCWAKFGSSAGLSKSRYEDEEVLLLRRALVTDISTWKNPLFKGEK